MWNVNFYLCLLRTPCQKATIFFYWLTVLTLSNGESMKHVISSHPTNVIQNAWHPVGSLQYSDRTNCEGKMGENETKLEKLSMVEAGVGVVRLLLN